MSTMDDLYQLHVSEKNLMDYAANISKWERLAGSEEEVEAFLYIKEKLANLGAKVTLIRHKAFISLPISASFVMNDVDFSCRGHSMSPSTDEAGLQAEVVYCDNLREAREEEIRGKLVMVDGLATGERVAAAQELGACGVVFISGPHIHEMCISNVWGSPSIHNVDQLPQIPAISVDLAAGEQIKKMIASGKNMAVLKTCVQTEWRKIPLLVVDIKSKCHPDQFVMFSGHVDSWYYGATDNAAANSIMMEVGRIALENVGTLKRSLRLVFFSGHSHGRYAGSAWYADNFWEDLHKNCCISINIDVLGFKGADHFESAIMPEAKAVVVEAVRKITSGEFKTRRYNRFADQSFWGTGATAALASFSRIKVKPGSHDLELGWWWHTPFDTMDKIDSDNLLRDGRIFAAIIMNFCTSTVIPLDFRAAVEEIKAILIDWQNQAGKNFDLSLPIERVNLLKAEVDYLYEAMPKLDADSSEIEKFNDVLLKIGRILVPLNYTQGKIFENDPAIPQLPVPSLAGIKELASADTHKRNLLLTELVRRRNYVAYALDQAIEIVKG